MKSRAIVTCAIIVLTRAVILPTGELIGISVARTAHGRRAERLIRIAGRDQSVVGLHQAYGGSQAVRQQSRGGA